MHKNSIRDVKVPDIYRSTVTEVCAVKMFRASDVDHEETEFLSLFAVERRRRDKINNWIVTLSKIIPDCSVDSRTGAVSVCRALPVLLSLMLENL